MAGHAVDGQGQGRCATARGCKTPGDNPGLGKYWQGGHGVGRTWRAPDFGLAIAADAHLFLHAVIIGLHIPIADGPVQAFSVVACHRKITRVQPQPNTVVVCGGATCAGTGIKSVTHRMRAALLDRRPGPF